MLFGTMIIADVRVRLEVERSSLLAAIAREEIELATPLDDKGEDLTASQHPADVASDLSHREFAVLTELTLKEAVAEIDGALARIARGTYALCVGCGRTIDPDRLAVRPQAARCIECQHLQERSASAG
jgi:DnaK suppressor protein